MVEAQAEWTQLMHEYAELWEQRAALADADFSSKLKALRAREVKVSSETAKLPSDDTGLAERCYAEVLKTRGLIPVKPPRDPSNGGGLAFSRVLGPLRSNTPGTKKDPQSLSACGSFNCSPEGGADLFRSW